MRITVTGPVTDEFHVLGHPGVPVYLLDGEVPALFDAGTSPLADYYIKDAKAVLGDRSPKYLFITHSHFDHVGAASLFKEQWPDLTIAASAATARVLAKPKAVELIRKLSREIYKALFDWGLDSLNDRPFQPEDIDVVLEGGETISLGADRTVEVLALPGHTWDFLGYWVPQPRIMVSSETVGTMEGGGAVVPEFIVDYDSYCEGLKKVAALDPLVLCAGHQQVITGEDVRPFLTKSLADTVAYAAKVEQFLREERGDVDRAAERVKQWEWDPKPLPKQPAGAYMLNTRARVQTLKKRLESTPVPPEPA